MAKRGGFPGGMPGNMANIMKQAQKMQKQMEEAQKNLEEQEVTATAGGGAVEVTVSGKHEVTKVKLAEEVVIRMILRCLRISSWRQPTRQCAKSMKLPSSPCHRLPVHWAEDFRSKYGLLQS